MRAPAPATRHVRRALGAVLALLCAAAVAAGAAPPTPYEQAKSAFWIGDFDALERLNAFAQQPGQRTREGISPLVPMRNGLRSVLDDRGAADAYYLEVEALTLQWTREHPLSPLAHILHAAALYRHGWSYRGGGFANTVPPQAWADFRNYMQRASDYLSANAAVAFTDTSAHVLMIEIGRASGWTPEQLRAVAQQGLKKNPDDDDLYFGVLTAVLPKWGGSARDVDRYIRDVAERMPDGRGPEMYARLYSAAAAEQFEQALFADTAAEWPKMQEGFRGLQKRYPSAWNLNRYAYFACMARDKATTLELVDEIGAEPLLDRWGSNGARVFETCKRWASQQ